MREIVALCACGWLELGRPYLLLEMINIYCAGELMSIYTVHLPSLSLYLFHSATSHGFPAGEDVAILKQVI